ncbi:specifically androgen-regulated gene protein [Zootoca vivipara]|uniref:specifically androgen-regulated gene protein n=1 Tax=Zootoca vivipara TaxID=8524 RepID=UPI00293B980A|nr:specifically androgen-regulated gene protein [Zootoca vivipara]XP_034979120.2 specifically androgen-regulated gene protein [Zootoca vivipara]XP_034979121.2 specifically androgen-regulated gene protein [Zootoca vivipara]
MPKKDLWLGTADPEPRAIVHSAGSCDSMISNDSSLSEKSDSGYDYLSVAEKECLMFLEETLDSLDTEGDSGVSTDEAETAESSKHPRTWPMRDVPKELDHENLGKRNKIEPKSKKCLSGSVPVVTPNPGHHVFPRNISVKSAPKVSLAEATGPNVADSLKCQTSWGSLKHEPADISNDKPKMSTQLRPSNLESIVIPPPEPFQDQRRSHPRMGQELSGTSHYESRRNVDVVEGYEAAATQAELSLDKMGVAIGKEAILKPLSPKSSKKISEQITVAPENYQKPTLEEPALDPNFKQGPPTAPKPRKLPPNIILKTSKGNAVSLNVDPSHKIKVLAPSNGRPRAATGDFSMEKVHSIQNEQGRARREALKKLGLPLDQEKDPDDHVIKTTSYSIPRETPRTSSRENVNMDNVTSDNKSDEQHNQVGGKEIYPVDINLAAVKQINVKSKTLERSGVGLSSCISSGSEDQNIKNSGSLGKMSFFDKITPNFLRSSRPRPASLGMGKDFVDLKENKMHNAELEKSDKRRSYPLQPSSKLPRPPCVSVKITPKGATEEHRKEALKKLGLLKE